MRKLILLLFISSQVVVMLSGQEAQQDNYPEHFIWKTTIGQSRFYICGSVHVGKKDYLPLDKAYLDCLAESDKVILEVADDFETMPAKMVEFAEKGRLPEEKYFRNNLKPEIIEKIIDVMGEEQFHMLDCYNSGLLISNFAISKMKKYGYSQDFGVDRYIHNLAKEQNKEIIGLDNLEFQFNLVQSDMPYEVQLQVISGTVMSMDKVADHENNLYNAYFNNDVESFGEIFISRFNFDLPPVKASYDKMLTSRNIRWADKIEDLGLHSNHVYFVMVGAGHLFGPDNLLELLRAKGYIIIID